ncbi:MAG: superoxide dismutase [Candidatus Saccharimonadales bacterium]
MYKLPALEYQYDALGRYISADIMRLHHDKHHQAYIDKLNKALDDAPVLKDRSLESLLSNSEDLPTQVQTAIRNNGGGHYNHTLFWQWMSPSGGGEPTAELRRRIEQVYGSYQAFVDTFTGRALSVFGSGWVWLQPNLEIITTPNQDNPIMLGQAAPLLGLDVWEHAYYLDYKNKRDDYIAAWWNVVDWGRVASRVNSSE